MGDGRIFLKSLCDASFNKDLSNEPRLSAGSISLDSTFKLIIEKRLSILDGFVSLSFRLCKVIKRVFDIFCAKTAPKMSKVKRKKSF